MQFFTNQFDECVLINYQSNGTFGQAGQKIVILSQDGQWIGQMGHPIVPLHVHVTITQHEQDQYMCVTKSFFFNVNFYCI